MSPLNQRRWSNFKENRRAKYSLLFFGLLFFLSLFAELLANDKPILIYFNGTVYWPIVSKYSEKQFGGEFETEAEYRDEFVRELIERKGKIYWPFIKYSFDTINYELPSAAPSYPTVENWLGTDDQGRDVVARLIYGFRISVLFGLILTTLSSIVGVAAGAVQGYFGGRVDILGQRFIEIWSGLPTRNLVQLNLLE
jgi:microcin C transport system permease protein